MGRLEEAEALLRESFETRRRVLGPSDPATLSALDAIAAVLKAQGRLDEASALLSEAVEMRTALDGAAGKDNKFAAERLSSMNNLGSVLKAQVSAISIAFRLSPTMPFFLFHPVPLSSIALHAVSPSSIAFHRLHRLRRASTSRR